MVEKGYFEKRLTANLGGYGEEQKTTLDVYPALCKVLSHLSVSAVSYGLGNGIISVGTLGYHLQWQCTFDIAIQHDELELITDHLELQLLTSKPTPCPTPHTPQINTLDSAFLSLAGPTPERRPS
jgi:hypothetical protein